MSNSEILGVRWFSGRTTVGIVKTKNSIGEIKYRIGVVAGVHEGYDARDIADWGSTVDTEDLIEFLGDYSISTEKLKELEKP